MQASTSRFPWRTCCALLALTAWRPAEPGPVQTTELVLVDEEGRTRGRLAMVHGAPELALLDRAGNPRLLAGLGREGWAAVRLRDADARDRAVVETQAGHTRIHALDQSGGGGISLLADDQGTNLTLHDNRFGGPEVRGRFAVTERADGSRPARLELWSEGRRVLTQLSAGGD